MKHFRLSVDGKPYEIEILNDPRADEVLLKIDGIEMTVKAENLDADAPAAAAAASRCLSPRCCTCSGGSRTRSGSTCGC